MADHSDFSYEDEESEDFYPSMLRPYFFDSVCVMLRFGKNYQFTTRECLQIGGGVFPHTNCVSIKPCTEKNPASPTLSPDKGLQAYKRNATYMEVQVTEVLGSDLWYWANR